MTGEEEEEEEEVDESDKHIQLDPDYCTVKNCVNPENCVISQMTNFLINKHRQKLRHFDIFVNLGTPKIASWYFTCIFRQISSNELEF